MGYHSTFSVQTQSFTIIGYRTENTTNAPSCYTIIRIGLGNRKQLITTENIAITTTISVQSKNNTILGFGTENIAIAAT